MFKFILLFAIGVALTASAENQDEKCAVILNSHCCKVDNKTMPMTSEMKECMLIPRSPGSCDRAICFGTKKGYATTDGTVKMDEFQKHLERIFSDNKDILEAIREECLSDNYTSYGEPDDCDLNKMEYCIRWQYTFRCPDFKDEGPCTGFKEIAEKCLGK